jgi:hypothetical protein
VKRTISFDISSAGGCDHPIRYFEVVEGFRITSYKHPNTVEIQFYGQYFDTTIDALGASWAGRFILFRHWYWIRLFQTGFKRNDEPFRLIDTPQGYLIGGSCCGHSTLVSDAALTECWEGGILLAANHGGWRRFIEHIWTQSARFMWMKIGRHMSRLASLRPEERFGIMDTPPNHEVPQDSPQPKYSRFKSLWKRVFPGKESSLPKQGGVRVIRKPRMRRRKEGTTQTKIIDRSEGDEEFASYDEDSKP